MITKAEWMGHLKLYPVSRLHAYNEACNTLTQNPQIKAILNHEFWTMYDAVTDTLKSKLSNKSPIVTGSFGKKKTCKK